MFDFFLFLNTKAVGNYDGGPASALVGAGNEFISSKLVSENGSKIVTISIYYPSICPALTGFTWSETSPSIFLNASSDSASTGCLRVLTVRQ